MPSGGYLSFSIFFNMRRPIPKYVALCVIVWTVCMGHAFGQCNYDVHYTIEEKSDSSFSILLKSEIPLNAVSVQLYDLFQGKVLQESRVSSLTSIIQEVFRNVPPSKYAIIIQTDNCDKAKTLGGIQGINIGIQD